MTKRFYVKQASRLWHLKHWLYNLKPVRWIRVRYWLWYTR